MIKKSAVIVGGLAASLIALSGCTGTDAGTVALARTDRAAMELSRLLR